jgi:enolase-phosphatase E1
MIRAVLTDIGGTTSSKAFTDEVLHGYTHSHLASFVRRHRQDPLVADYLAEARAELGATVDEATLIGQLLAWIDTGGRGPAMEALQLMLWESGYRAGAFTSHVYEDAYRRLHFWHDAGVKLYVFAACSVARQRLFFAHTQWGDLRSLFAQLFDSGIGGRRSPDTYYAIAKAAGLAAREMCFLSAERTELDAAQAVGMRTRRLVRHGNMNPCSAHLQVADFNAIELEACGVG